MQNLNRASAASHRAFTGEVHSSLSEPGHDPTLLVRAIENAHERFAAAMLVRRMYAWRGYRLNDSVSLLNSQDAVTIAAWEDREIAATLTLNRDTGSGLLCESLYPLEIAHLRAKSRQICEYTRFATDPDFSTPELLETLFIFGYELARFRFGATDAVIEVNPRHARYYERDLGFSRIGECRICPRVEAPAILLHRNLSFPVTSSRF